MSAYRHSLRRGLLPRCRSGTNSAPSAVQHHIHETRPRITDQVWITDVLLERAFSSFSRYDSHSRVDGRGKPKAASHLNASASMGDSHNRRSGSSVPGPLEARRRLARRKNADLAMAGSAAPVGIGVLFGFPEFRRDNEQTRRLDLASGWSDIFEGVGMLVPSCLSRC